MTKPEALRYLKRQTYLITKAMEREDLDPQVQEELNKKAAVFEYAIDMIEHPHPGQAYWKKRRLVTDEFGNKTYECLCSHCNMFSLTTPRYCSGCGYEMVEKEQLQ